MFAWKQSKYLCEQYLVLSGVTTDCSASRQDFMTRPPPLSILQCFVFWTLLMGNTELPENLGLLGYISRYRQTYVGSTVSRFSVPITTNVNVIHESSSCIFIIIFINN